MLFAAVVTGGLRVNGDTDKLLDLPFSYLRQGTFLTCRNRNIVSLPVGRCMGFMQRLTHDPQNSNLLFRQDTITWTSLRIDCLKRRSVSRPCKLCQANRVGPDRNKPM